MCYFCVATMPFDLAESNRKYDLGPELSTVNEGKRDNARKFIFFMISYMMYFVLKYTMYLVNSILLQALISQKQFCVQVLLGHKALFHAFALKCVENVSPASTGSIQSGSRRHFDGGWSSGN